jgi:hypothetical protein
MMKRSTLMLAALLAAVLPMTVTGCDDDYQGVDMDEGGVAGGPSGTARGTTDDRYQDAATGAVGTDAGAAPVTGDGREGPDTVYSPAATPQQADTVR